MKIIVYGMGIIGGSVAASLKRAGHTVLGKNRTRATAERALSLHYIDGIATSYEGADVVILALPPRAVMRELEEGNFPAGVIVTDICGVKAPLERVVDCSPRTYRYVGMHPMAGKETTGLSSASPTLFDGKNLILVRGRHTDEEALRTLSSLGREMGFGRIVVTTAERHDGMIALTSQLAHIVSNAYVKSENAADCVGFTGGSFQDMTRIASLDEQVWTELFSLNRAALVPEINRLISALSQYRDALSAGDEETLKVLLAEGKKYHGAFLKNNEEDFS